MTPARDSRLNPVLSLALCAAAGYGFMWLGMPLPWMIGPMLAMAACNFSGAGLRAPRGGRHLGQLIIGCALGLYFTPDAALEVASYWPLLLAAVLMAILLGWLCGWFLARITGTDSVTAFFASVPGGAVEMAILGERFGGRVDRIALAQSLRILTVVIAVPFVLTYTGVHGSHAYQPAILEFRWGGFIALLAVCAAAGGLLEWLRMPNAFVFGSLAVTATLTASQIELSSMPVIVSNAGQMLLGCALGARFERRLLSSLPRYAAGVLASIALAIVLSAGFAALLAWESGLPVPSLVLATAPGGIAEMCITAKVLQLGVPLVTAAHVARILVLLVGTGPMFRLARLVRRRMLL